MFAKALALGFGAFYSLSGALPAAHADMTTQEYLNALQVASQKVARQKAAENTAGALSSNMLIQLQGRYYRKGDTWEVAAWQFDANIARRLDDREMLKPTMRKGGVFRYEVIDVKPGNTEATLKVTQVRSRGLDLADANVESLTLVFNDKQIQTQKAYRLKDSGETVVASPNGLRSSATRTSLELFPLDAPEVNTAERLDAHMPELPTQIKEFADAQGWKPNLAQSVWFEQDDFFGRPVQMLWQKGDPWPAYFKTPQGVAILLSKGDSR